MNGISNAFAGITVETFAGRTGEFLRTKSHPTFHLRSRITVRLQTFYTEPPAPRRCELGLKEDKGYQSDQSEIRQGIGPVKNVVDA